MSIRVAPAHPRNKVFKGGCIYGKMRERICLFIMEKLGRKILPNFDHCLLMCITAAILLLWNDMKTATDMWSSFMVTWLLITLLQWLPCWNARHGLYIWWMRGLFRMHDFSPLIREQGARKNTTIDTVKMWLLVMQAGFPSNDWDSRIVPTWYTSAIIVVNPKASTVACQKKCDT